jgi:hypothetical protein
MRLDNADDDVPPEIALRTGGHEHGVRLSDAGRCAEEDGELAAPCMPLLLTQAREENIGVGAAVPVGRHDLALL